MIDCRLQHLRTQIFIGISCNGASFFKGRKELLGGVSHVEFTQCLADDQPLHGS